MKTKNLIITPIMALTFAVPAFADPNIAVGTNPAACNESVLETTSGTSNLQANWTANTLNLQWTAPDADNWSAQNNTCTYDSGITVPQTNPTKTGYTFAGWRVKTTVTPTPAAQCNIPSAYLSETTYTGVGRGASAYCEGFDGLADDGRDLIVYGQDEGDADCSDSRFAHLSDGEWSVTFSTGMVKGRALCSSTPGEWATAGTPNTSGGGQYCWCQPTEYIANGSSSCNLNVSSSSWVGVNSGGSTADNCALACAYTCAGNVLRNAAFRGAVFGLAGE